MTGHHPFHGDCHVDGCIVLRTYIAVVVRFRTCRFGVFIIGIEYFLYIYENTVPAEFSTVCLNRSYNTPDMPLSKCRND